MTAAHKRIFRIAKERAKSVVGNVAGFDEGKNTGFAETMLAGDCEAVP